MLWPFLGNAVIFGPRQPKKCLLTWAKCADLHHSEHAQSHSSICFPLKQTIIFNDSVCGQRRPRSDCACAQSDLSLPVRTWTDGTFSLRVTHFSQWDSRIWVFAVLYISMYDKWQSIRMFRTTIFCIVWNTPFRLTVFTNCYHLDIW